MAIYYVDSENGQDANIGSDEQPCKTLMCVLNKITENTSIHLGAGTYTCDATIITKINANISLTIIGMNQETILKPTTPWGNNNVIGVSRSTISIRNLIYDMSNILGTNTQFMNTNLNMNNVVLMNIQPETYATFIPYNTAIYNFTNCIFLGNNSALMRTTNGSINLYNCYGRVVNGYNTTQSTWNISNNYITMNPQVDSMYNITDISIPNTVGLYTGKYAWIRILIKKDNLYFSILDEFYDTKTKTYTPLSELDFTKSFNANLLTKKIMINNESFYPMNKFNNFKVISPNMINQVNIFGLKTQTELIVASDDINISLATNIDNFNLLHNISGDGNIRIALSIDKGNTWLSWDGTKFVELNCKIPNKSYETFNEDDILAWNNAREIITISGILLENFNSLNFNLLQSKTIRFAYVLIRPLYSDNVETTQLKWQFDAKGSLKLMKPSEYEINVYENKAEITSLLDSKLIKVNMMI